MKRPNDFLNYKFLKCKSDILVDFEENVEYCYLMLDEDYSLETFWSLLLSIRYYISVVFLYFDDDIQCIKCFSLNQKTFP